jgi:hypothetical protein
MQPPLPLAGLSAPPPLACAWEHLAPDEQTNAIAVLARLMAQLVQPAHEEEHDDD